MNVIQWLEKKYFNKERPKFKSGDRVKVHVRIQEGEKERIQIFEGIVIKIHNAEARSSFTVRKMSYGVGVERVFPFNAPVVERVEVVNSGKVRRAKLYYLRGLSGKKARISVIQGESAASIAAASLPSNDNPTDSGQAVA